MTLYILALFPEMSYNMIMRNLCTLIFSWFAGYTLAVSASVHPENLLYRLVSGRMAKYCDHVHAILQQ